MTREEREDAIDIIQSILDKYEEDECLVTEITIGDEDIKAFKMAIRVLEQEPTTKNDLGVDCISRQFMYDLGATCIATRNGNGKLIALGAIEELPSVVPQEPRKGHWESIKGNFENYVECSICGKCSIDQRTYVAMNFCPFCGADMSEAEK